MGGIQVILWEKILDEHKTDKNSIAKVCVYTYIYLQKLLRK